MDGVESILEHIRQLLDIDLLLLVEGSSRWDLWVARSTILLLELPVLALLGTICFLEALEPILIVVHGLLLWLPVLRRVVAIVNWLIQILIPLFCQHIQRIAHQHLLFQAHSNFLFSFGIKFNHSSHRCATGSPTHHAGRVPRLLWVVLRFWMDSSRWDGPKRYVAIQELRIILLLLLTVIPDLLIWKWQSRRRLLKSIQWWIHWVVFNRSHNLNLLSLLLGCDSSVLITGVIYVVIALVLLCGHHSRLDLEIWLQLKVILMLFNISIIICLRNRWLLFFSLFVAFERDFLGCLYLLRL